MYLFNIKYGCFIWNSTDAFYGHAPRRDSSSKHALAYFGAPSIEKALHYVNIFTDVFY